MEKLKTPRFWKRSTRRKVKIAKYFMVWCVLSAIGLFVLFLGPKYTIHYDKEYTNIYVENGLRLGISQSLDAFYSLNPKLTQNINQLKFKKSTDLEEENILDFTDGKLRGLVGAYRSVRNTTTCKVGISFYSAFTPSTVYHEVGHEIYSAFLSNKDKTEWKSLHKKPYPTEYAGTDKEEDFAESFSHYLDFDECLSYLRYLTINNAFCPSETMNIRNCPKGINATYECYWERGNLEKKRVDYLLNLDNRLDFRGKDTIL